MKVIKITVDDKLSILDTDNSYESLCNLLPDADGIEFVTPRYTDRGTVLVVDECGKLKGRLINAVPSFMYGYQAVHHSPIVGDVLIMKYVMDATGMNYVPLTDKEAETRVKKLLKEFSFLKRI